MNQLKTSNNRFDRDKSLCHAACEKRSKPRANPSLRSGRDLRVKRMLGGRRLRGAEYSILETINLFNCGEWEYSIHNGEDKDLIMKRFEIRVENVTGYCSCGYKPGDIFIAEGLNTPDKAICGGAYTVLFPMQNALASGARFSFEENPKSKTNLTCPDKGAVTFTIALLD
jgi:uncharacterized repeat protein (TIGR04076 family)